MLCQRTSCLLPSLHFPHFPQPSHVRFLQIHGASSARPLAARRKADPILALQTRRTRAGCTTHEPQQSPAYWSAVQQTHASTTAAEPEHAPRRPLQQQASAEPRLPVARPHTRLLRLLEPRASTTARLGPANPLQHDLQLQPAASSLALQQPTAVLPSASSTTATPVLRLPSSACKLRPRPSTFRLSQPPANPPPTAPSHRRPTSPRPKRPRRPLGPLHASRQRPQRPALRV